MRGHQSQGSASSRGSGKGGPGVSAQGLSRKQKKAAKKDSKEKLEMNTIADHNESRHGSERDPPGTHKDQGLDTFDLELTAMNQEDNDTYEMRNPMYQQLGNWCNMWFGKFVQRKGIDFVSECSDTTSGMFNIYQQRYSIEEKTNGVTVMKIHPHIQFQSLRMDFGAFRKEVIRKKQEDGCNLVSNWMSYKVANRGVWDTLLLAPCNQKTLDWKTKFEWDSMWDEKKGGWKEELQWTENSKWVSIEDSDMTVTKGTYYIKVDFEAKEILPLNRTISTSTHILDLADAKEMLQAIHTKEG